MWSFTAKTSYAFMLRSLGAETILCFLFTYDDRLDRLCGLVVKVLGYRFRGPSSIPGATKFFLRVVVLERGPLSLVMIIEELFQGNSGSGLENKKLTTVGVSLR
jgi:hypothetical protein